MATLRKARPFPLGASTASCPTSHGSSMYVHRVRWLCSTPLGDGGFFYEYSFALSHNFCCATQMWRQPLPADSTVFYPSMSSSSRTCPVYPCLHSSLVAARHLHLQLAAVWLRASMQRALTPLPLPADPTVFYPSLSSSSRTCPVYPCLPSSLVAARHLHLQLAVAWLWALRQRALTPLPLPADPTVFYPSMSSSSRPCLVCPCLLSNPVVARHLHLQLAAAWLRALTQRALTPLPLPADPTVFYPSLSSSSRTCLVCPCLPSNLTAAHLAALHASHRKAASP